MGKILVARDNEIGAGPLLDVLRANGHDVVLVRKVDDAMARLRSEAWDAVLAGLFFGSPGNGSTRSHLDLDVHGGVRVADEALHRNCPRVAITTAALSEVSELCGPPLGIPVPLFDLSNGFRRSGLLEFLANNGLPCDTTRTQT